MKQIAKLAIATAASLAVLSFAGAGQTALAQTVSTMPTKTEMGHRLGNEDAPVTLIALLSYTCPACARFTQQSEGALQLGYIGRGDVAIEYRPMIHNPVDLTVTMMIECGPDDRFYTNHLMVLTGQPTWLGKARNAPREQVALWSQGDKSASARRSIASALDLYRMFEQQAGYRQTDLDRCLSDQVRADELISQARMTYTEFGLPSTPSFVIEGEPQADVHSWEQLWPLLDTAIASGKEVNELDQPSEFGA